MNHELILLVDAGNSRLKMQMVARPAAALFSADWLAQAPMVSLNNEDVSADVLVAQWQQHREQWDAAGDSAPRLSWLSVGPASTRQAVQTAFERLTDCPCPAPWEPTATLHCKGVGITTFHNHYRDPKQLGADRWVSALGLACRGVMSPGQTHMVVSAGTATTIDVVQCDAQGDLHFLGGWILPGIGLMEDALRLKTRDLNARLQTPSSSAHVTIPVDSYHAIRSGIGLAQIGAVAQAMRDQPISSLWLHGGYAAQWQAYFLAATDTINAHRVTLRDASGIVFLGLLALSDVQA